MTPASHGPTAAPSIDFYSPDIYWPEFQYWVQRYRVPGNPIFIPEARMENAPYNAFYAYGQARAFGFSPFAIENLTVAGKDDESKPQMMQVYELLKPRSRDPGRHGTSLPKTAPCSSCKRLRTSSISPAAA